MEYSTTKLLVQNTPSNQELLEIGPGGRYAAAKILWDERKDGVFPEEKLVQVGGLERVGKDLVFNATMFEAQELAENAQAQAKLLEDKIQKMKSKHNEKLAWSEVKKSEVLTPEELAEVQKKLDGLGDEQ